MPNIRVFIAPDTIPPGESITTMGYAVSRDGTEPAGFCTFRNEAGSAIVPGTRCMGSQARDGAYVIVAESADDAPAAPPDEPPDADEPIPPA